MSGRYLDVASTWPLRPAAARAIADAREIAWADPTRRYGSSRAAAQLLARATATVAERLGARDDDVVWTSGGTEAVHLATLGAGRWAIETGSPRRHVVATAVEHSSVLAASRQLELDGFEVTVVPVDGAGLVDPDDVADALRDDTLLVHVQHANHEVGTLQPTHEIAQRCHDRGAWLHVDACQAVGQLGVTMAQTGADLLSLSAPKFGGPSGVGALVMGERARLSAILRGDDRQAGRRAGRLDTAAIAGASVALAVATGAMDTERSARELVRRHLRAGLAAVEDTVVHGPLADAHPGIVAASALYVDGEALVVGLDRRGFAVHSGSACATRSGEPSHVLAAMGALTHGHVRVSFDDSTTIEDADAFLDAFGEVVEDLRSTATTRNPR